MAIGENDIVHENNMEISEECSDSPNERFISVLDEVELRVEGLRQQALAVEKEKESLLQTLHCLQQNPELYKVTHDEREEINITAERLICRCLTVDVSVTIPRTPAQEQALQQCQQMIRELEIQVREKCKRSTEIVQTYMNACLSEPKGPVDQKFQSVVIGCTVDDQKQVRKKLCEWSRVLATMKSEESNNVEGAHNLGVNGEVYNTD
ncbi:BAG family molecular chaperone regulator 2 [Lingula anatina]|uniref:BAG family molecular chaperone regulator 2 n=1 Tax=Lingula anatina TaxID=7574 RepID=A0A1S3HR09_LINAN|nr:BAG family molecular chaperone regulator 2 [Lingula anatina]|eukprot:XP_013388477.1 BAG family molecular chaperone regulator 2 [Lingula anatina]